MTAKMKRREFITVVGGTAAWPLVGHAQQPTMPVVGYLYSGAPETSAPWTAAFRQGLSELGFHEGRNVAIEFRWANNETGRLPELAADLVHRRVAVVVAPGTAASVLAAKAATTTIPIVFRTGGDPVELGFVSSLNRPGGNVTGVGAMSLETGSKRLGLLRELLPSATRFAALINPDDPNVGHLTKACRRRLRPSGGTSKCSAPATAGKSMLHSPTLRGSVPMHSWSARKGCSATVVSRTSRTRHVRDFQGCISCASSSRLVA